MEGIGVPQNRAKNTRASAWLTQATLPMATKYEANVPRLARTTTAIAAASRHTRASNTTRPPARAGETRTLCPSWPVPQRGCAPPASIADPDRLTAAAVHQKAGETVVGKASKGRHESSGRRTGAPTSDVRAAVASRWSSARSSRRCAKRKENKHQSAMGWFALTWQNCSRRKHRCCTAQSIKKTSTATTQTTMPSMQGHKQARAVSGQALSQA